MAHDFEPIDWLQAAAELRAVAQIAQNAIVANLRERGMSEAEITALLDRAKRNAQRSPGRRRRVRGLLKL